MHIRAIAPSSGFERDSFLRGVERLQGRFELSFDASIFERDDYLAGVDQRRSDELNAALADPSIDALMAARGGYGSMRLLPTLDPKQVKQANKPIIGMSDITALHALWSNAGVPSLHASMVAALGKVDDAFLEEWISDSGFKSNGWVSNNEENNPPKRFFASSLRAGIARGELCGGNLAILASLAGTPFQLKAAGKILFLEDINESPYKIDRMLTTLRMSNFFADVRGIVCGQFLHCGEESLLQKAISRGLGDFKGPIGWGVPAGHDPTTNRGLWFGRMSELGCSDAASTFSCF